MTFTGIILLAGFIIFAALMVMRLLPTLLALPLLAAWIAFVAGMPFVAWLNDVLLGGALRLASPIALVIFGAMFARVIQKTGISDAIIKKAAELSGDQPVSIAFLITAATVFVFSGMSGLGPVIMTGSIMSIVGLAQFIVTMITAKKAKKEIKQYEKEEQGNYDVVDSKKQNAPEQKAETPEVIEAEEAHEDPAQIEGPKAIENKE